ncbi:hypothetical protein [Nocardia sp. NPDC051750]|uniref:hypothetical protein n=1 Tax=Nocardia sp. NPDC051750 TaxID=3364325 RepID=UPI0037A68F0F
MVFRAARPLINGEVEYDAPSVPQQIAEAGAVTEAGVRAVRPTSGWSLPRA